MWNGREQRKRKRWLKDHILGPWQRRGCLGREVRYALVMILKHSQKGRQWLSKVNNYEDTPYWLNACWLCKFDHMISFDLTVQFENRTNRCDHWNLKIIFMMCNEWINACNAIMIFKVHVWSFRSSSLIKSWVQNRVCTPILKNSSFYWFTNEFILIIRNYMALVGDIT